MPVNLDRKSFLSTVGVTLFHDAMSASQAAGISAILDAFDRIEPHADARFVAYSLATVFHETAATMQPIEEYGRGAGRSYGVPAGPYHRIYDGRGDVQLTFEGNYAVATRKLREHGIIDGSIDLEKNPELAMRPDIAAAIMIFGMAEGWFTGAKLADYFGVGRSDWVGARRIINGLDCATKIAGYGLAFLHALETAWGPVAAVPAPAPVSSPPPAPAKGAAAKKNDPQDAT